MEYVQEITLDVNPNSSFVTVTAKQDDVNSRKLLIHFTKDGEKYKINSNRVWLRVRKPDGHFVLKEGTINQDEGTVEVNLTPQILAVPGRAYADIIEFNDSSNISNTSDTLSTASFIIIIQAQPSSPVFSSDDFLVLKEFVDHGMSIIDTSTDLNSAGAWLDESGVLYWGFSKKPASYNADEEKFTELSSRVSELSAQIDESNSVIADLAAGRTSKMLAFTELYYREYETGNTIDSNGSKSTGLIYCHANPLYTYRYTYHGFLFTRGCAVAFFDADQNYLKSISIQGANNCWFSGVVPEDAFYVEFSSSIRGVNPTACLEFEQQSKLTGKKIMFFGDSITATQTRYVDRLLAQTGMVLVHNFAVPQSAWVNNTRPIKNQVQVLLNNQNLYEAPDIVFISAGTNDNNTNDNNEPIQSLEIEQYFTNSNGVYIPYTELENDNITRAMRWCISTIQNLYPNAMVFVTTPIQAAAGLRPPSKLKTVADIIKLTANRMSVRVIDAFGESGIYGEYENASAEGKYLKDGLHPKDGTTILGDFYAQELNTKYCRNA